MIEHHFRHLCFYLARYWRIDRTAVCCSIVLIFSASLSAAVACRAHLDFAQSMKHLAALKQEGLDRRTLEQLPAPLVGLSPFRSAELPDALNQAASVLSLPVNEMTFALDNNPILPYVRYTATVKVFGGYLIIRGFVDTVRANRPEISLDAITCTRTDIRSVHLSCDLTLTAFYARESNA